MSVKDMLAEFKMEDKRNGQQNNNRAAASATSATTTSTPSSYSSSSSSSPYSFPRSADPARGDGAVGPNGVRLGEAVVESGGPSQKTRKGKKGKKERRR